MRYAYDLNIDVDEIRKDINFLIGMYNEFDKDYLDSHGCQTYDESVFYPSFSLVADLKLEAIQDFYKLFNNSFISVFKIFQMQPNEIYGYHIDNNKHKIYTDIPQHMICPAAINILLSKPVGDTTKFALDYDLKKYKSWDGRNLPKNNTEEFTVIDSFEIKNNAELINIGTWHRIDSLNTLHPRKMASFTLWPYNTWQGYVEFCRNQGILIER